MTACHYDAEADTLEIWNSKQLTDTRNHDDILILGFNGKKLVSLEFLAFSKTFNIPQHKLSNLDGATVTINHGIITVTVHDTSRSLPVPGIQDTTFAVSA